MPSACVTWLTFSKKQILVALTWDHAHPPLSFTSNSLYFIPDAFLWKLKFLESGVRVSGKGAEKLTSLKYGALVHIMELMVTKEMTVNMDFHGFTVKGVWGPGDLFYHSQTGKAEEETGGWPHLSVNSKSIAFPLELSQFHWPASLTCLSFCVFVSRTVFQSLHWNNDRVGTYSEERKKISHDSQEACLSKSTRLMRCLLPKHSAVAKGCEMWLRTALELWLTGVWCQHAPAMRGKPAAQLQPGSLVPQPSSAALQIISALLAAPLGNFTSTEYALGMGLLCETRWKIMYQIKLDRETCKKTVVNQPNQKAEVFPSKAVCIRESIWRRRVLLWGNHLPPPCRPHFCLQASPVLTLGCQRQFS